MKKRRNTLIFLWILSVCFFCLFFSFIFSFFSRPLPYTDFELLAWSAMINTRAIEVGKKQKIIPWDEIKTLSESYGVISWWDGSLTRLGENSHVIIQENEVSRDKTEIRISFELLSGKSWSNIISFLSEKSYFKQNFDDVEAGVRGTIFDVDLDVWVIHVSDHSVELILKDGKNIHISQWETLSLSNFSLLELSEYIRSFKDSSWSALNSALDADYQRTLLSILDAPHEQELRDRIIRIFSKEHRLAHLIETSDKYSKIESRIDSLDSREYPNYYRVLLSYYQKHNAVRASDHKYYKTKVYYKRALTQLAPSQTEKNLLLQTSLFDLEQAIKWKNIAAVTNSLDYLTANKDELGQLKIPWSLDFIDGFPTFFSEEMRRQWRGVSEGFWYFSLPEIDLQRVSENAGELFEEKKKAFEWFLERNISDALRNWF